MLVKELTSKCLEKVIEEVKKEENMTRTSKRTDHLIQYNTKNLSISYNQNSFLPLFSLF